ncbi:MAG: two component signal transduction system LytR family response regulator [Algoriphagus marincola HL-49]|uniref:Two component signal transduction system LytR family response regulator n=1 Tax=Algoriphagus marincola HL-49 TaxID=1305737 RepID=A0A0P7XYU6_9BACT|nr:MAG: two component signal transduction system LytR family response regulator [Algoriphagus marincola HL-49]
MIQYVIVEDEIQSAERLKLLMERSHQDQFKLMCWLKNAQEIHDFFQGNSPDLVFWDVELGEKTAFEWLTEIPKNDFQIIFTTGHQEYALPAIKANALDYLLKPIDADELAESLKRVQTKTNPVLNSSSLESVLKAFLPDKTPQNIALPTASGLEFVPVESIMRCQADVNYTHFFLRDGRKITSSKTLKAYEAQLSTLGFFRVHNSHLVNLNEVRLYTKGKGGYLTLKDGSEIEVASRRKDELLQMLKGF